MKSLRRETLAEQLAESLAEQIGEDGLAPGQFLPSEAKLVEQFGVSRPVVREALRLLTAQGIIHVSNGRGAIVKPVTSDQLQRFFRRAVKARSAAVVELLEVRKGIEVQGAMLAAQRREEGELQELGRTVTDMRRHLHDADAYTDLDAHLHLKIADATHNEMLCHLVESIREPLKDTIRLGLRRRISEAQLERVQELHEQLIVAVEAKDAAEAARVMARHFDEAVMAMVQDEIPRRASPELRGARSQEYVARRDGRKVGGGEHR